MKKLLALPLLAVALLAIAAPGAVAKPVRIKVVLISSVVKAADGTITARFSYKAKDPACLKAIPFEPGYPTVWLFFPNETGFTPIPSFQLPVVGRAAYGLTIPPETAVTVDVAVPPSSREKRQFTTSQAIGGQVLAGFRNPNPRSDLTWKRKSKTRGRVICAPQPLRGGGFGSPY